MWDKVVTYFKAVFFQGWFWAEKSEQYKEGLSLIIIVFILVIVLFALAKFGFFRRKK